MKNLKVTINRSAGVKKYEVLPRQEKDMRGYCFCIKNANCYHYSFSNTRNRNEISVSSWDSAARRSAPPRGVFQ